MLGVVFIDVALIINGTIRSLIDMLYEKGFHEFKSQKYLKELSEERIDNNHIKTINSLINDFVGLCKNKSPDNETVFEIIKFVRKVTKSDVNENYTDSYSDKQKKELLTATLELLSIEKFQNQIFTKENRGFYKKTVNNKEDYEQKAIGYYIDTLINISNSNLFQFLSPNNQNKFFGILKLLFENENISKNIFNEDNLGNEGPIRLYITALSNSAAKIRPPEDIKKDGKTKKNNRKKHSIINDDRYQKVEIFNQNIRFLLKAAQKIVTDKNLKRLVFDIERNPLLIVFFLHLPLNLARHIQYLREIGYEDNKKFEGDTVLFDILEILLGEEFTNLFTIPLSYVRLFFCFGELSCYSNILNNEHRERLSTMINKKLLCEEWTQNILNDEEFVSDYFEYLTILFEKTKDLIDTKTLIASIYDCFEKSYVLKKMPDISDSLHSCLITLENVTRECKNISDEDLAFVYGKIVRILKNIQNDSYLFKEQIFQTVENQINKKDINDDREVLAFLSKEKKGLGNKKQIIRVYTSILKNMSQLSSNKKINVKDKIEFFGVIRNILLEKDLQDIRKMIFNQNEQENEGAIYNFTQTFSNLLLIDNLNNPSEKDKKICIQSLIAFICDENLKNQICNLAEDKELTSDTDIQKYKSVIIRFYTSMLKNITQLSNEINIDVRYTLKLFTMVQNIIKEEKIGNMIFNGNENGPQGAVCNLMHVFFYLFSKDNLKTIKEDDKNSLIQTFLLFVRDEELRGKIFQSSNDGKNGAIDFYLTTLSNLLFVEKKQFTVEDKKTVISLFEILENNRSKAKQNINQCVFYDKIAEIKKIFGIQRTINNKEQKKLPLFKFARNIFGPQKVLNTSKSMHDLFLPNQELKISQSKNKSLFSIKHSEHKMNFMGKSGNSSNSSIKTLKTSKSTGDFLQIKKKSSNKQLTLNINIFKPQTNKINKNINSINISTGQKPKTIGQIDISKDCNL